MPPKLLCLIFLLLALLPQLSSSQTLVQTGRYTTVYAVPTDAQRDPLQAVVTIEFPDEIETVGQAVNALLADTGYRLEDVLYWDVEVFELVEHAVPRVQRELGPLTVLDAIKTLIGSAFGIDVDPIHRELAFELVDKPHSFEGTPEPEFKKKGL
jgi:type IV pili sensor histidine kinase/response regulator